MVTRGGEIGRCWPKSTKFQFCGMNKSRDVMYNIMTIVKNTVWNTENLLKEYISGALTTCTKKQLCEEIC